MSYNPYGGPHPHAGQWPPQTNPLAAPGYGPPPTYGSFPGAGGPPGMVPPPGLGPPPGMSSAPGMAPPGVQQPSATQANRPSGLPPNFQPPPNLPNINFNAKVIRLGGPTPKPGTPTGGSRRDEGQGPSGGPRAGLGGERGGAGGEYGRQSGRESAPTFMPFTSEEKLRTAFVHKIPEGVGDDIERILGAAGRVRRWDGATSVLSESSGTKFGFALFEDAESFSNAVELLKDVELPAKRQPPTGPDTEHKDDFEGIEKVELQIAIDESSQKYLESYRESRGEDAEATSRLESARAELKGVIRELFYPPPASKPDDGDVRMTGTNGENVEVVNIPLAQEDELADIPAEMREIVAGEIASFRERSNRRDMERMKREEELEEMERQRTNRPRSPHPDPHSTNNIPLGPRALQNAPSGPKGMNARGVSFVNGGGADSAAAADDTDASDEEVHQRQVARQKSDEEQMYQEAERKWVNRERSRAAALGRETDREKQEAETLERRRQEQLEREAAWDDEKEAARKTHPYYRDPAGWARKRNGDRAEEQSRDAADRRVEEEERKRETAELERTRGMADSFLDRQAKEMMEQRSEAAAAPAPQQQPFKLSLGAAAQRAQAQRAAPQRRTIAEVEGLLADEEQDAGAKRQLVPIQFEPSAATSMTDEEISNALRSLAQEIPSEKDGLWAWDVKWEHLDEGVMREKLRPFVEKKIVEYLGVQEEVIVEVIEEHLRAHGKPGALVDELAGALDEEAEDLVKKLWRMVIFFTESEKRGLPA